MKLLELLEKIEADDISCVSFDGIPPSDVRHINLKCKGVGKLADAEVANICMCAFGLYIEAEMPERGRFIKEGNEKGA